MALRLLRLPSPGDRSIIQTELLMAQRCHRHGGRDRLRGVQRGQAPSDGGVPGRAPVWVGVSPRFNLLPRAGGWAEAPVPSRGGASRVVAMSTA